MFKVLFVDIHTGKILNEQKEYQIEGTDFFYYFFQSFEEALSFSKETITQSPEIECTILDEENNVLQVERNEEGYKQKPIQKKRWWHIF